MYPQAFTERWGILFIIISFENGHFTMLQHKLLIKHYNDMPHLIDHRVLHHPLFLEFRDLVFFIKNILPKTFKKMKQAPVL